MGFFQDLKQDLSQTVNDLETEDAVGLNLGEEGATASEDLFGEASDTDFADLEAMLEKGVAALGDASVGSLQEESVQTDVDVAAMMETMETMDYAWRITLAGAFRRILSRQRTWQGSRIWVRGLQQRRRHYKKII